jgi:hypothetical protein
MSLRRSSAFLLALTTLGLVGPSVARGDFNINGSFGTNGDIGFTGPTSIVSFGPDSQGSLYQMDTFLNIPAQNGGTSYDLANGTPAGLSFAFSVSQPNANQLLLSYTITNTSAAPLVNAQLLYFVDPDIGPNYADETASVTNPIVTKPSFPASYQIGDPSLSSIFTNLFDGMLNNQNSLPPGTPYGGDVSEALGFNLGTLGTGQTSKVDILLSDNGATLNGFYLTQTDPVYTGDVLTISGEIVPEPSSFVLVSIGLVSGLGYSWNRKRRVRVQA